MRTYLIKLQRLRQAFPQEARILSIQRPGTIKHEEAGTLLLRMPHRRILQIAPSSYVPLGIGELSTNQLSPLDALAQREGMLEHAGTAMRRQDIT